MFSAYTKTAGGSDNTRAQRTSEVKNSSECIKSHTLLPSATTSTADQGPPVTTRGYSSEGGLQKKKTTNVISVEGAESRPQHSSSYAIEQNPRKTVRASSCAIGSSGAAPSPPPSAHRGNSSSSGGKKAISRGSVVPRGGGSSTTVSDTGERRAGVVRGGVVPSQLSSSTLASAGRGAGGGGVLVVATPTTTPTGGGGGGGGAMAPTVMNTPTRIESGRQRFLILDAPSHENLAAYIAEMKAFEVTDLIRTCEPTYDESVVHAAGIQTHELIFPDGEAPPDDIIDEWLELCDLVAQRRGAIAVHCVAGLGRAPVLVAIALIEKGMDPMDAIMFIRERRKGKNWRRWK